MVLKVRDEGECDETRRDTGEVLSPSVVLFLDLGDGFMAVLTS